MKVFGKSVTGAFRALTVGVLAFCCLPGLTGQTGRVLCVGEGGHRHIEYAQNGPCVDSPSAAVPVAAISAHLRSEEDSQEHCGRCVDIPMLSESARHQPATRAFSPEFPAHSMAAFAVSTVLTGNDSFHEALPPANLPHHGSAVRSLRATVLLI